MGYQGNIFGTFVLLLTVSCFSYGNGGLKKYAPLQNFTGKTVDVRETITVGENEIFDGNGDMYDWNGEGDCSQREGMPPMFILLPGSTLKNLWIRGAPDGIHVKGSNIVIDNIVNVDVCEDAISISKSKHYVTGENIKILNSEFFHCHDKAIQLTRGTDILIKNNEFYDCAKAVRIKEQAQSIRFEDNRVFDARSVIKVTGGKGYAKGNFIRGSRVGFWAEKSGSLIDTGGNVFVDVIEKYRETEGGKVTIPAN
ncbi:hypothetical protein FKG94_16245 [Exilibacterium tricleocarpae]|uniref:Pectate lyase n=1 Tax=Exilibacterium tricleocarpae TaxID=2591008 RepID=A0A545TAB3_9GAMM|nr:pectate lyase [Exilibacterium tricleocarpae]TQV74159.1 hypothetical protein FKG94_16245 [Exilibacterium tricleocarpae]